MKRGFALPLILVIIVAGVVIIGSLTYLFNALTPPPPRHIEPGPSLISSPQAISSTPTDETANWKTFTDSKNKLTFKYPNDWLVISKFQEDPYFNCEDEIITVSPRELVGKCPSGYSGAITIALNRSDASDQCDQKKVSDLLISNVRLEYIDGIQSTRCVVTGGTLSGTIEQVAIKDKMLIISYTRFPNHQNLGKEFELFLSTFRFD